MSQLKVIHDEDGNHNPLAYMKTAKLTDPYVLRGATLRFVCHELNRTSAFAVWEDVVTHKQYRTDVRHLEDAVNEKLPEGKVNKVSGCFITGDFGFKQVGAHVLLYILQPSVDVHTALGYAVQIFTDYLAGKLKGPALTREIKIFMKELNRTGSGTR